MRFLKRSLRDEKVEKDEKFQEKIGRPEYLNKNCWLAKTVNYSPAKRCQYCESKFRHCLFFQYLIISFVLIFFLVILSFLIEGRISNLVIVSIFVLVIVYGRFFNKSTERIIKANFGLRKAKEALEELTEELEKRVEQRTEELRESVLKEVKQKEEIQKLSVYKSELLSIASHQIKNPLAVIKGYASLITDKTISDSKMIEETSEKIKAAASKLLKILNNLLDFHHIEEGKMHYEFQKLELNGLLKDTVNDFQIVAKQKGLDLIFEPALSEVYANADIYKLSQVFQNLIDNSIKYTDKGWVKINLQLITDNQQQESILITISDSGRGMSKDLIGKLFEEFQRGVKDKEILGTGLGLYICKEIVKAHQGEIWVESPGESKGSTFFVRLKVG